MTKTWNQTPPKTMTNGWLCPQCKQLTEHIIKYKKSNDHTHTSRRNLVCMICEESTIITVTKNSCPKKLVSNQGSKLNIVEVYQGNERVKGWIQYPKTGRNPNMRVEKT